MADCERLATCIFFNGKMAQPLPNVDRYKYQYCHADFARCARYMVFMALGGDKIPGDLYPHDVERARQVITASGHRP